MGMTFLSGKLLWKGVTDDILTPRINKPGSLVGRGKRWVRAAAHSPPCSWPSAPDLETSVWASKDTGPREERGQDEPERAELGQHHFPPSLLPVSASRPLLNKGAGSWELAATRPTGSEEALWMHPSAPSSPPS